MTVSFVFARGPNPQPDGFGPLRGRAPKVRVAIAPEQVQYGRRQLVRKICNTRRITPAAAVGEAVAVSGLVAGPHSQHDFRKCWEIATNTTLDPTRACAVLAGKCWRDKATNSS